MTRNEWGFSFYDFANSAYVLVVGALLYPIFFKETLFLSSDSSDFYWGLTLSLTVFAGAVISPFVGFLSDKFSKRHVLATLILLVGFGTAAIGYTVSVKEAPIWYVVAFSATHVSYILSVTVYDSYLQHVSQHESRSTLSTFAWGFGYLGGVFCLFIVLLISGRDIVPSASAFIFTAAFFLFFSFVSLARLPEPTVRSHFSLRNAISSTVTKNVALILVAFWLINDAIVTITYFTTIYGRETLSLGTTTIGLFLIVIQILAFPATWLMGKAAAILGDAKLIIITCVIWIIDILVISSADSIVGFAIASAITSLVIGSTQALMRSYYSKRVLNDVAGVSFGVYAFVSRTAAMAGPLIFGFVSTVSNSQRLAMLFMGIPIAVGAILFFYIDKKTDVVERRFDAN